MVRTTLTATEWANFFWLRDHDAADPSIAELARVAKIAYTTCDVQTLAEEEWHLPFVDVANISTIGNQVFCIKEMADGVEVEHTLSIEDAIRVSCARAAATSFRNTDYALEKCLSVYDKLVHGDRIHGGALEHACKVPQSMYYVHVLELDEIKGECNVPHKPSSWEPGITHTTRNGDLWGNNLRMWIQHRGMLDGQAGPSEVG
jgi:hypothetical protein